MKKITLLAILVFFSVVACTGENAMIKVKESTFCSSIPEGHYSVICEIAAQLGTTPEAIRMTTKLANLAGVDQWYEAAVADDFLERMQAEVVKFKASSADWPQFAAYLLGQYNLLPPKVQAAIIIAKDFFEFNPPEFAGRPLSELDWIRIEGNLAEQRALLAPFKN